jgi:hypothetical protein
MTETPFLQKTTSTVLRCATVASTDSRCSTVLQFVTIIACRKNIVFLGKIKFRVFACFSCKTNSFSYPGWFCWPIGITAALLKRMLPSNGPFKKNKNGNFGPKVLQIVHFLTGRVILNLYEECRFAHTYSTITIVC